MGARRLVLLSAQAVVCLAGFCLHAHAQGREKRVTPVDATQRATFERERKVGVAILVGVGKYPRYSGLGELRYPARDADLLESELSSQRYTVITLKDAEATRGAILNAIRQSGEVIDAEHGTLVFFFSGHGFAEANANYLASYDATGNDLARSGLDLGTVEKAMVATGARRRVMWVDACRDEPGKGAGDARSFSRFEGSSGTRILFSTKAGRISYEDDDLKQGLFSYYLARGLHGDAARDDGMVSFRDLADFVVDGVESRSLKQGRVQVPYEAGESSGDFLLARVDPGAGSPVATLTPKPTTTPATTPSGTATLPTNKRVFSAAPIKLGNMDVSHFAGLQQGDGIDTLTSVFGQPQSRYGNVLYFSDGKLIQATVVVNGQQIRGITVFDRGLSWVRARTGSDALLDLIGKSLEDVLAVFGRPSRSPREEGDGWRVWDLPQGGELTVGIEHNRATLVGVDWTKQSGVVPKPRAESAPASPAVVGRISLSRFAGIAPGDSALTVDTMYLRPKQTSESTQIHGGSDNPGFGVSYEGGVVKGVGAFAHELTWIRVHGGNDPLLDLMGKNEAEVTAVLGPATRQEGTGAYRNLYWGFPWKGQPAPASPNARSDATVTVEFNSGVCQFVGVRW